MSAMAAEVKPLGIVVVGLGRAGKARVRDLKQKVLGESAILQGVISRRKVDDHEVNTLSWDEALSRDDVDALVICTENDTHEEYARKTLEHGKHVLIEFPLCLSAEQGKGLFNLAESKGLICRVENIALLLPSHHDLKQTIRSKTAPLQEGTVRLDALLSKDWIADLSRAGFPSFAGISDLERLTDLFGKITLKEAHFVHETDRRLLTCKLFTPDNRPLTWIRSYERGREGNPRQRFLEFKFEDGTILTPPPASRPPPPTPGYKGLFARDLELFLAEIRGERSREEMAEERKRVLDCLELAEEIEKMASV